jgi:glycine cleavage system H protein
MMVPEDLKYTESHEWVRLSGSRARVGITEFAQSQLADLTFVDLPAVGSTVRAGQEIAVVESVKAASDVYSPVSGKVVAVNENLPSDPGHINTDPFGDGWMFEVELSTPAEIDAMLDAAAYRALLPAE